MSADDPERDLFLRAQGGDRAAFEELVSRHRSRLFSVIYLRIGPAVRSRVEPEDIFQETILSALRSLGDMQWKGSEAFFGWLRQTAEHIIINIASRQARQSGPEIADDEAAEVATLSRTLRREERFDRLQEALGALSPDHRRVILLAKIEGRPIKEIARDMDRSPDAITNLLARALSKLKERFGDTESLHLPDRLLE